MTRHFSQTLIRARRVVLLAGLLATAAALGQDGSGVRSGIRGQTLAIGSAELGRYVFAGIGIDRYPHSKRWSELDNAGSDVEGLRDLLLKQYGFEAPEDYLLRDQGATREGIYELINGTLMTELKPLDNLILFFAGHGHTRTIEAGGVLLEQAGYIIPHDGTDAPGSWISIEDLLNQIARLPARHILVILDSCHSGIALTGGIKTRGSATVTGATADIVSLVSRRVITSAGANQEALDQGHLPGHSLFTGWLVEGLRRPLLGRGSADRGADLDDDGAITTTELFNFVRSRVTSDAGSRQIPDAGSFKLDQRGELIITLAADEFRAYYDEAVDLSRDPRLLEGDAQLGERFLDVVRAALEQNASGPRGAHLVLLRAEYLEADGDVLAALSALETFHEQGVPIPLHINEVRSKLRWVRKVCAREECRRIDRGKAPLARGAPRLMPMARMQWSDARGGRGRDSG